VIGPTYFSVSAQGIRLRLTLRLNKIGVISAGGGFRLRLGRPSMRR
jgi:hypothetical protein